MTDYERDYTSRLEKRLTRVQAECDGWRQSAICGWAAAIVLAGAFAIAALSLAVTR